MPYIDIKVSKPVTKAQQEAVKAEMGRGIAVFPGKTEMWLMVGITDEYAIWFKGDGDDPCAMVEVSIFGALNSESCNKMTGLICKSLSDNFGISPSRIYVKYQSVSEWGWNGENF